MSSTWHCSFWVDIPLSNGNTRWFGEVDFREFAIDFWMICCVCLWRLRAERVRNSSVEYSVVMPEYVDVSAMAANAIHSVPNSFSKAPASASVSPGRYATAPRPFGRQKSVHELLGGGRSNALILLPLLYLELVFLCSYKKLRLELCFTLKNGACPSDNFS